MISTFRRLAGANGLLFRIQSNIPNRANRIAVWRGGTWNDRPIRPESMDEESGARWRHGVTVDDRFVPLVEIMNSPEAADPQGL